MRYLRALPSTAPDRDAALAPASDTEQAYEQIRAAHGSMAAGALNDSSELRECLWRRWWWW